MEFAVIQTGGKQYKVAVGDSISIEKLPGEYAEGDKITFDKVLLVDNGKDATTIGDPYIKGASVTGHLSSSAKDKKISVIRFRAKSRYFKKKGHRQEHFLVKIDSLK
jgi:large subunit ribosomal protein L21